ncbi:bacterio-opsin activator, partial [Halobium palmae]
MKALTLRLAFDEDAVHPMHAFVAEHPEYGSTRLLQWNPHADETTVMLFHVDGPEEPFLSTLGEVETAEVVEPSAAGGDGFYLYVRERPAGSGRELIDAYAGEEVDVAPPIVYDVDGSMRFTVVGDAETLQR